MGNIGLPLEEAPGANDTEDFPEKRTFCETL